MTVWSKYPLGSTQRQILGLLKAHAFGLTRKEMEFLLEKHLENPTLVSLLHRRLITEERTSLPGSPIRYKLSSEAEDADSEHAAWVELSGPLRRGKA